MDEFLDGLNPQQKCAVTSASSVVQVLAPPGSGKTKTLTARVAYLISKQGYKPWNIIVCTFTIKAAREMKERIRSLVGDKLEAKLHLGTFHSVARRYLVTYGHYIGIDKNFGIADSSDTIAILKRIIKRRAYQTEPSVARSRISRCKAQSEDVKPAKTTEQQEFESLFEEYEETLATSNLLDYDDLLLRCADLLRQRPACVSNVEAVLIDEFQDTNHVQYDLMTLFAQSKSHITIVGDPDQSIYGFRSAEVKNLKRMQIRYPDTQVILLEENYRSSGAILASAIEVIEQDEARPKKPVSATHGPGVCPVLRKLPSAQAEASWIVAEIERARTCTGDLLNHSDFAILLRSASLSRLIESAMGKAGVPYRMVGGHKFFDRHEIKVILNYLRVTSQPDNNDAVAQVINVPSRKIGEVTVKGLLEEAEEKKCSLWSLVLGAAQGKLKPKTKISTQAMKGMETFANLILTAQKKMSASDQEDFSVFDLVWLVLKRLSFEDYLKRSYPEDIETRWANVRELIMLAGDCSTQRTDDPSDEALPPIEGVEQRQVSDAEDSLAKFLANVALSTEVRNDEENQSHKVTISTIHAAKGLEWPVVFIPATYEGSIPHSRADDDDEERRLLYVGMTRAQALLYLSCPSRESSGSESKLSHFLSSRTMSRYFDIKGPSIGFSVTQDLARILRRTCPTDAIIQTRKNSLSRHDDDYFSYDGEETNPENSTWDQTGARHASRQTNGGFKRRKVEDNRSERGPMPGFTSGVTILNQQNYSISNTTLSTGFVSASSIRVQETQSAPEPGFAPAERKAQITAKKTAKKEASAQGGLMKYFAPKAPGPSAAKTPADEESRAIDSAMSAASKQFENVEMPEPLQEITNEAQPKKPPLSVNYTGHKVRTLGVRRSLHGWSARQK
ncbi:UvrD-helicase-domain-containing protein [Aulographum hederae CBS 113979]|uniref:DNA 3'-5' helicase n=1 Tax=Aulographum hederae CBS 113979 TaxID=1176131 RepID=A0A6G1GNK3_9PEZI|nr:UvrD-helicase-domain-containing protein [Aulographum hederae CBS 113979]